MGNCKAKPKINTYTNDVDYTVDGWIKINPVKFGASYYNLSPAEYQTKNGNLETVMHLYSKPATVWKSSQKNENDLEIDIEPLSSDEMTLYAKPLQSSTNKVSEISTTEPLFHILESGMKTAIGKCSDSVEIIKQFEALREKYHRTKLDRDQLVKKNFILSKELQKAEALNTIQIRENEQFVQQSQTDSVRWKELATAVQTANAGLVENMETMGEQLEFLAPQNFALVKKQNGLVEELAYCEVVIKNEIEQRRKLSKVQEILEVKLKQEKASTLAKVQAQEMEFEKVSKKLEIENISLENQINDITLKLENSQRQMNLVKKEGNLLNRMLEKHKREDDQIPVSHDGGPLRSNEEAKLVLSSIIEQVGKQRSYFSSLYELCKSVVTGRDKIMEDVESLKIQLGEEFTNEDTVRVGDLQSTIDSCAEDERSDTERLKARNIRRGSSWENLTAKIGVLQMESRHKSKMIRFLEQEQIDEFGNVIRYDSQWGSNLNRSPMDIFGNNRYQMLGEENGENRFSASSDSAELGDDEAESVIYRRGIQTNKDGGAGGKHRVQRSA